MPQPADDFVEAQGHAYLAHILRRLSDELVRGAEHWYPQVGVTAPPRSTSTLLALDEHGPLGITQIASLLRQSHPLIINWCRQLVCLGFVEMRADPEDGRRSLAALTDAGRREVVRLREALVIMGKASQQLADEAQPGLFEALWRMERALQSQGFGARLRAAAGDPGDPDRLAQQLREFPDCADHNTS